MYSIDQHLIKLLSSFYSITWEWLKRIRLEPLVHWKRCCTWSDPWRRETHWDIFWGYVYFKAELKIVLFTITVYVQLTDKYESIRWPATLGFLTVLLLLCTILVIGVARSSRCALIFFSVFGLFGVIICWLLSGIYLASSVALGDFCMRPNDYLCRQVTMVS